jgi:hypothetical protein
LRWSVPRRKRQLTPKVRLPKVKREPQGISTELGTCSVRHAVRSTSRVARSSRPCRASCVEMAAWPAISESCAVRRPGSSAVSSRHEIGFVSESRRPSAVSRIPLSRGGVRYGCSDIEATSLGPGAEHLPSNSASPHRIVTTAAVQITVRPTAAPTGLRFPAGGVALAPGGSAAILPTSSPSRPGGVRLPSRDCRRAGKGSQADAA